MLRLLPTALWDPLHLPPVYRLTQLAITPLSKSRALASIITRALICWIISRTKMCLTITRDMLPYLQALVWVLRLMRAMYEKWLWKGITGITPCGHKDGSVAEW